MWLLETTTRRLRSFTHERNIPKGYAILSHTWEDEEVTFEEIHTDAVTSKKGYSKIEYACRQAFRDGYSYVWIDTCCINKQSSAELSEAINSMFRWYQSAAVCYVYLVDFEYDVDAEANNEAYFQTARWWSRGWTLQELIAPSKVQFYDRKWHLYGDKAELADTVCRLTRIDPSVIQDAKRLQSMSVAKRMSWASRRVTSGDEDQAYALLGIFNVSMPLLYGEGGVKAFQRLQEEIIRTSTAADHSILAWMSWEGEVTPHDHLALTSFAGHLEPANYRNLLSPSPYGFRHGYNIVSWALPQSETFDLTSRGFRISIFTGSTSVSSDSRAIKVALNCRYEDESLSHIVLYFERRPGVDARLSHRTRNVDEIYDRLHHLSHTGPGHTSRRLASITSSNLYNYRKVDITMARQPYVWPVFKNRVHISYLSGPFKIIESCPANAYNPELSMLTLSESLGRYNSRMNPAYGAIRAQGLQFADGFVLTIDRLSTESQSSTLRVDVCSETGITDLGEFLTRRATTLIPNVAYKFDALSDSTLEVKARYVSEAGEFFWAIEISQSDREERSSGISLEERHDHPGRIIFDRLPG